ncbi:MAG: hypothetical protein ACM31L_01390 [Actinomycetota bacterium]
MTIPRSHLSLVAAWLAGEGFTVLTAPRSLVAKALKAVGAP